jgi:hypothetical protein
MALDLDQDGITRDISRLNESRADFLGLLEVDHVVRGIRTEPLVAPGHAPDPDIPPLLRQAAAGVAEKLGSTSIRTRWVPEQ